MMGAPIPAFLKVVLKKVNQACETGMEKEQDTTPGKRG